MDWRILGEASSQNLGTREATEFTGLTFEIIELQ